MENKNLPAFPATIEETVYEDHVYNKGLPNQFVGKKIVSKGLTNCAGLSKLELMAANAPAEIPDWFIHTSPPIVGSSFPSYETLSSEEDKEEIKNWLYDPIYDLSDHLKWFSDAVEKYHQDKGSYNKEDLKARYFQWRVFYAESLLAQLEKLQP
jgi:hypothetical protein